ncbi:MAG: hypothetical protein PUP92_04400 [Rhizonema sp. PD38]|nr:hypothetical protein [Rhizonema sp. PD38]
MRVSRSRHLAIFSQGETLRERSVSDVSGSEERASGASARASPVSAALATLAIFEALASPRASAVALATKERRNERQERQGLALARHRS